jgi:hypothetical protein
MKIIHLNRFVENDSLKARLKCTYRFSDRTVEEGLTAYKEFLQLKAVMEDWEGDLVVPTRKIADIWTMHVLDTKVYQSGCQEVFGKMIEYDPDLNFTGELFRHKIAQTKMIFKARFEHDASGNFWNEQSSLVSEPQQTTLVSSTDPSDNQPIVVLDDSDHSDDSDVDSVVVSTVFYSTPEESMLVSRPDSLESPNIESPDTKSPETNDEKTLTLTILFQPKNYFNHKFHFEIARTTTFKKGLTGVLAQIGVPIKKARLVFNNSSSCINLCLTPNDYNLEDGDILELYQKQVGC